MQLAKKHNTHKIQFIIQTNTIALRGFIIITLSKTTILEIAKNLWKLFGHGNMNMEIPLSAHIQNESLIPT